MLRQRDFLLLETGTKCPPCQKGLQRFGDQAAPAA
jgi:hypothetical protein